MDVPKREELLDLISPGYAARVSMYLPTHRFGPDTRQDPIRLKNLIRQAEYGLVETGWRRTKAKDMLAPASALVDDYDFWQRQSNGLALFVDERSERHFRVPLPFTELAVVAPQFHLKPLLPLLAGQEVFYVLALSVNQTLLLECSRHVEEEIKVPDMPRSMADALWTDDREKQIQFRSFTTGTGDVARFHGAGGAEADQKGDLLRYFREVDRALCSALADTRSPLVLACVEYLAPIYRQASNYPYLSSEIIPGSPEELRPEVLRSQGWDVVEPAAQAARGEALARYRELQGTGRTANTVRDASLAALEGRIEAALVAVGVQRWGQVDANAHVVHEHEVPEAGDQDLLDFVAIQTLLTGGEVFALAPEGVPESSGVAVVFRY